MARVSHLIRTWFFVFAACTEAREDRGQDVGFAPPGDSDAGLGSGDSTSAATGPGTRASSSSEPSPTESGQVPALDVGSTDPDGKPTGSCDCVDVRDGVYLLSLDLDLWFYDPLAVELENMGALGCSSQGQVNSMAVDRQGSGWVNFVTANIDDPFNPSILGEIVKIDLSNPANCGPSGYTPPKNTFVQVGMGFATRSASNNCDDLFVYEVRDGPTSSLGKIDRDTLSLEVLGSGNYPRVELTGTGDARLFAFADGGGSSSLVQYDKDTAEEISVTPLPGLTTTNAFSFAFWGGDFHFFTAADASNTSSKVSRLDYDANEDGALTVTVPNAPALFIGAGVSTCASFEPPAR